MLDNESYGIINTRSPFVDSQMITSLSTGGVDWGESHITDEPGKYEPPDSSHSWDLNAYQRCSRGRRLRLQHNLARTVNNSCEVCFAVCRAKTRVGYASNLDRAAQLFHSCDKLISIYDLWTSWHFFCSSL